MANNGGGAKFLGRNMPPRVQIEYEVEHFGAQEKVRLPFRMLTFTGLSGDSKKPLPSVEERDIEPIKIDTFDAYMTKVAPRVTLQVPSVLTEGEGQMLNVDMSFESIDDFSPTGIADKVDGLKQLYEARRTLADFLKQLEGNPNAEKLLADMLKDPELMKLLSPAAA
jgi:type VI secretion system protein ImpB